MGFVIPIMYHLFEWAETVICLLPNIDMASDKWNDDIFPVIQASRYRELLPRAGAGSKGGTSNLTRVQFANGANLRFMSGGSGDKGKAGKTTRVIVITEVDGMDESGGTSREADPIAQVEARTQSYGSAARIYGECTVSFEDGRTWREYKGGTGSRIAVKCPHCGQFVTPEREHLTGWQGASDVLEAGLKAAFLCPGCGILWSDTDRERANRAGLLVHRGQEIADGRIVGPLPRTNTLGFRWSAVNNLLVSTAYLGEKEWTASRQTNEDNAEKEMCQFVWAIPHKPSALDLTALDAYSLTKRTGLDPQGYCPSGTRRITCAVDVGKWLCHWVALAWTDDATPRIIDYGRLEVPSSDMSEEQAILTTLRRFRDEIVSRGWESAGGRKMVDVSFIDSGYKKEPVYAFCRESRGMNFYPSKGFGTTQRTPEKFRQRNKNECVLYGDGFQGVLQAGEGVVLLELNSDHWKGFVHSRLQTPIGQPGALTLFKAKADNDHLTIAKHFCAEKREEDFVPGQGTVTKWVAVSRNNHYLDATAYACAAGYAVGERMMATPQAPKEAPRTIEAQPATYVAQGGGGWVNGHRGKW